MDFHFYAVCHMVFKLFLRYDQRQDVMNSVSHNGLALQKASAACRDDKEIVLKAVSNIGWALKFASKDLRADKEVVMAAVTNAPGALKFCLGWVEPGCPVLACCETMGSPGHCRDGSACKGGKNCNPHEGCDTPSVNNRHMIDVDARFSNQSLDFGKVTFSGGANHILLLFLVVAHVCSSQRMLMVRNHRVIVHHGSEGLSGFCEG